MSNGEIAAATMATIQAREAELLGKPPRIGTVDRESVAEEVIAATTRLRNDLFGPGPALPLEVVPQIMFTMQPFGTLWERIMGLSMCVMGPDSRLPRRLQKLAILRTGWLLGAPFEFGEHVHQSRKLGFSAAEIDRIVEQGSAAAEWLPIEQAVLRAAEELRANAYVGDETWAALSQELDQSQVFELMVLIGQFTNVAYFQNSLRLSLEANNKGLADRGD